MSESKTRKRHGSTFLLRKYLISTFVLASFGAYVIHEHNGGSTAESSVTAGQTTAQTNNSSDASLATNSTTSTDTQQADPAGQASAAPPTAQSPTDVPPPPTTAPPTAVASGYKDGQYTGQQIDAFYGIVQVQVDIQGGKITNVQFLQYPNDRQRSAFINSQAMPMLQSETIQAQSAQVDIIGGATLTSQAFVMSLQSALASAKA